ncbi:MAG TPA: AraC family transcriptional regulator [Candidatus Eisenbergiella merdipullorum]|uniref:AraC family transcriptional regulator n=1 Tax=Candidatus Eisenbergiella merdipullorum TaxID=2838553 RepID=A0A9D2KYH0_9FIRM|nr:AraC family transcriptional regulator [Candidatus Eisenbergiella merdipullorum]
MEKAQEVIDSYYVSRYRIIYTWQELGIPGLRMFGKHTMNQAHAPLLPHFHRNAYEFTFVTEGAIHFTIQEMDYELSGYDVFMTRPNEVHSTNLLPLSAGEIIWFQLDISDPDQFLFLSRGAAEELMTELAGMKGHVFRPGSRIFGDIRRAFELAGAYNQRHLVCSYLTLILYELTSFSQKQAELPGIPAKALSPDMEKAVAYIQAHLTKELSLEELAGLCRLSVSQFKQKFRAQIGMAPRHYVNYHKIQLSKKMLLSGASVTDTAMELGFGSSSYFTVVFKRYSACTPSEYLRTESEKKAENASESDRSRT